MKKYQRTFLAFGILFCLTGLATLALVLFDHFELFGFAEFLTAHEYVAYIAYGILFILAVLCLVFAVLMVRSQRDAKDAEAESPEPIAQASIADRVLAHINEDSPVPQQPEVAESAPQQAPQAAPQATLEPELNRDWQELTELLEDDLDADDIEFIPNEADDRLDLDEEFITTSCDEAVTPKRETREAQEKTAPNKKDPAYILQRIDALIEMITNEEKKK